MATLRQADPPPPSSRKRVTGPAANRVTKSAANKPAAAETSESKGAGTATATTHPTDSDSPTVKLPSGETAAAEEPTVEEPTVDLSGDDEDPTVTLPAAATPSSTSTPAATPPPAQRRPESGRPESGRPESGRPEGTRQQPRRTAWRAVLVVYVSGVLAAVALGALAPVAPFIQEDFSASLAGVNWAASAITAVGAVLGVYLGIVARRWSRPTFVVTGLVLVAAMAFAGAMTWALLPLLATRVIAGVGYLMVVIACPSLIAQLCTDKDRATALSVWGTFVPVGLSGSAWLGGTLQPYLGWRGWLAVSGAAALILAGLVRTTTAKRAGIETATRHTRIPTAALRPVALLAAGFCMTSLTSLGIILLIPGFLIEERGMTAGWAGTAAAIATIVSVPGSLLTGWLMARGVKRGWIACAGLLWIPTGFVVFLRSGPVNVVVAAAIAVAIINGLLVSLVFATVPVTVSELGHLDFANGAVAQLGCLGTLVGPPLFGAIAGRYSWGAVGFCIAAASLLAVALLLASLKVSQTRRGREEEVVVAVAGPDLIWGIARRTRRRLLP